MELMFLLTGYGSLNATLSVRTRPAPSPVCPTCQTADEDWQHVLVECPTYDDIRNLADFNVVVDPNGAADVRQALQHRPSFTALNTFAKAAFDRRKTVLAAQQ